MYDDLMVCWTVFSVESAGPRCLGVWSKMIVGVSVRLPLS